MSIVSLRYKSTNYYLVKAADGYLAFDVGWPGTFAEYRDAVKQAGVNFKEIQYFVVSHFHIDHAGLAGMLLKNGLQFFVFENQVDQIAEMEELITRKNYAYTAIDKEKLKVIKLENSRKWLNSLGILGEVVQVFGHGDQSVVLCLDSGEVLIGDLPVMEDYDELTKKDWAKLKTLNVKKVFPAHRSPYIYNS